MKNKQFKCLDRGVEEDRERKTEAIMNVNLSARHCAHPTLA